MKKKNDKPENALRRLYDFSRGVRGKYAQKHAEGTNLVFLDPDLREVFPDSRAVNEALRSMVVILQSEAKVPAVRKKAASSRTAPARRAAG